jgi:hypothetical protein
MQQLSTIGRPVDFRYKTNKAIALITLAVILVAAAIRIASGGAILDDLFWGLKAELAVFLTWALGRELDPDHDLSAFVAVIFSVVALGLFGLPSVGLLFWLLLISRTVNRTTGAPASVLDSCITLALAVWLSKAFGVAILYLTAGSFFLDAWIGPKSQRQFLVAGLAVIAAVGAVLLRWAGSYGAQNANACLIALAFTACFTPIFIEGSKVECLDDKSIARLQPLRVQSAQVMALLSGILLALLLGVSGLKLLSPLWAIAIGAPIYWVAGLGKWRT